MREGDGGEREDALHANKARRCELVEARFCQLASHPSLCKEHTRHSHGQDIVAFVNMTE